MGHHLVSLPVCRNKFDQSISCGDVDGPGHFAEQLEGREAILQDRHMANMCADTNIWLIAANIWLLYG